MKENVERNRKVHRESVLALARARGFTRTKKAARGNPFREQLGASCVSSRFWAVLTTAVRIIFVLEFFCRLPTHFTFSMQFVCFRFQVVFRVSVQSRPFKIYDRSTLADQK